MKWIPWWAKILLKIVWSRLPVRYDLWKKIGVFRHGFMESPEYVSKVFFTHWNRVSFPRKAGGFHAIELGCGDSLASCLIASALGATNYHLVDAGAFAVTDIDSYRRISVALAANGTRVTSIDACQSVEEMLVCTNSCYLTGGLQSLKKLPSGSVDFIWSQAVLEHLRNADFLETMRELRRVIRSDGVMSHRVDLKDHLAGALNNLRFEASIWESPLMSKSGFYTNRIRFGEMIGLMRSAGFSVDIVAVDRWQQLPTARHKLSEPFRSIPDEDLLVSGFDVVMRPA